MYCRLYILKSENLFWLENRISTQRRNFGTKYFNLTQKRNFGMKKPILTRKRPFGTTTVILTQKRKFDEKKILFCLLKEILA